MSRQVVVAGSPTALGGHFAGMERGPTELRDRGLLDRVTARLGDDAIAWTDIGDAPNDPGWVSDPDPVAKNRALIEAYLPRFADLVAGGLGSAAADARLLVLGGDCTSHPAALAGIRRARPGARLGLAWFDAHGDFNTPATTPSGNVWGMPFAMACGRGDADLVAAVDGPTIREENAALLGGQVLDETESRMLAASRVAHFGAGMLGTDRGRAALAAWAGAVAATIDGWYIAFDVDALDSSLPWSVAMPEPNGLRLDDAVAAIRILAASGPVIGFGPTAVMPRPGGDLEVTVDGVADLTAAALS